jgi:hypothetical protein
VKARGVRGKIQDKQNNKDREIQNQRRREFLFGAGALAGASV